MLKTLYTILMSRG